MAHRTIRRVLIAVGVVTAFLLVLFVAGILLVRASFPRTRGTIQVPGLHSSVEVLRDTQGVPQIYATDTHDLFFAQGYVHAQDRFWQMDFWRHIGSGRLSEMFGESQLETDKFLRTLGWARVVREELAALDPESLAVLDAYAEGVNAYLAQRRGPSLSLEYAVLGLLTPGYTPEPWTPLHSLTWAKAMAWDLGGNMKLELERAVLLRKLGPQRLAELFPPYPAENPVIVAGPYAARTGGYTYAAELEAALPALSRVGARMQTLNTLLGGGLDGIGSNNWVVSGSRTTTGAPLLANDMHLAPRIPSIWYENGLHCEPVSPACPLEVVGYSFAGLPGVIVGHNRDIAWGVTNVGPDVQDLYLERLNPQNSDQYEVNGQWVDMTIVEETIQVAGSEPVLLTVRTTRHGPILSDVDEAYGGLAAAQAGATGESYAVALRWTALDPTSIVRSELHLDQAHNWDEFRAALRDWDVPSQNFIYADRIGNIGYQTPGRIPIRASGDGRLPVPGWTDAYDWTGYIPFEELPSAFNPPQGFIATANNAVVGAGYPYLITTDWDYGYRARRIVDLLEATPKISAEDFQRIHGDDFNAMGPVLVPLIEKLEFDEQQSHFAETAHLLEGWDYQNRLDSAPAALFNAFWRHLLLDTFGDELPPNWIPGGSQAFTVVRQLVQDPANAWWDDLRTSTLETRDDIFETALAEAVTEVEAQLGKDPARWTWGALHTITFENESLGRSGVAPIEALFNRGPFATAGGSSIVNATSWDPVLGYAVNWVPSQRMIVDLADFDRTLAVHTTGQSGHAYHVNYIDMADAWRTIQYFRLPWTRAEVTALAAQRLVLEP
jgi:penicillin amidase